jgi:endonuclease YncB( thermonuclease family)
MNLCLAHRLRQRSGQSSAARWLRLGFACLSLGLVGSAHADCGTPSLATLVVGVDERLNIVLQDGRLVRLAGLDTLDSKGGGAKTAEARQFLADRVVGREVELRLLSSGLDRWGRLLADLSVPETNGGGGGSVAVALLSAGFARVRPEFEARNCATARLAVEDSARLAGLGLWNEPEYAVIHASDGVALREREGEFVVIEGRVRRVGFGRSRLYLNLAPRDGPTIVIPRKLESVFARTGISVEGLAGKTIRARGALDVRIGPRIEVNEPAMIEIVRPVVMPGAEKPRQ